MALEAGGSTRHSIRVAAICAAMAALYAAVSLTPVTRGFFELTKPDLGLLATSLTAAALTICTLALAGFSPRSAAAPTA